MGYSDCSHGYSEYSHGRPQLLYAEFATGDLAAAPIDFTSVDFRSVYLVAGRHIRLSRRPPHPTKSQAATSD
jgi:hypothetical protein